jgi:hypothetical protein
MAYLVNAKHDSAQQQDDDGGRENYCSPTKLHIEQD